jgi:hypothetical protein
MEHGMVPQYEPTEPAAVAVALQRTYSAKRICTHESGQLGRNVQFVHIFTIKRRGEGSCKVAEKVYQTPDPHSAIGRCNTHVV